MKNNFETVCVFIKLADIHNKLNTLIFLTVLIFHYTIFILFLLFLILTNNNRNEKMY